MPNDPESTLPDLKTNPAAYPDPEPGEAPTTPGDKVKPESPKADLPPNPADPTAPPVAAPPEPHPGEPTRPVPEAALKEGRQHHKHK